MTYASGSGGLCWLFVALAFTSCSASKPLRYPDPVVPLAASRTISVSTSSGAADDPSLPGPSYSPEIPGFVPFGRTAQGVLQYCHQKTDIMFVYIDGGAHRIGTDYWRRDDDRPIHAVTLSPFLLARYEVSAQVWNEIMEAERLPDAGEEFLPMVEISWDDCQDFCSRTGLRLPTEAQWEFACRAGTGTAYGFGDDLEYEQANVRFPEFDADPFPVHVGTVNSLPTEPSPTDPDRLPIGSFPPNDLGVADLVGNVAEWCEDAYEPDFYSSASASGLDPICRSTSQERVVRGCTYSDVARDCWCWIRRSESRSVRSYSIGFRPAYWPIPGR
jgi:formylglycine-generating enzyme required for sulfatase activity